MVIILGHALTYVDKKGGNLITIHTNKTKWAMWWE